MISPYDYRTKKTRDFIMGNRNSYSVNKYYKSAEGNFYFYINKKGYYHIVKPHRVKLNGMLIHYEISDYVLTKKNTLRGIKTYGCYKTLEDCIAAIEEEVI